MSYTSAFCEDAARTLNGPCPYRAASVPMTALSAVRALPAAAQARWLFAVQALWLGALYPLVAGAPAVIPAVATAKARSADSTEWGVRAGYDFGVAKLQAAYQSAKLKENSPFGWTGETAKNKRWVLSATVPVTAKIGVIGEYAQAKLDQGTGNSDDKNKAYTLAATYSLSKRTTAYAAFVAVRPEEKNTDVNVYGVGVRHAF